MIEPTQDRRKSERRIKMEVRSTTDQQERRLRLMAYAVLAVFGIIGFWRMETINDRVDQEAKDRTFEQCNNLNDSRAIMLEVVQFVAENRGSATDFSVIEGFETLEPEVQSYLRNLSEASSTNGSRDFNSLLAFSQEILTPIDCDSLVEGVFPP